MPIDPLTGASLLILAASGAQPLCAIPQPAKINIIPKTASVIYDYDRSFTDLQKETTDTINPYGYNSVTHTNGFMSGKIKTSASVKLDAKKHPRHKGYCMWYESVDINIAIEPTIVIATEVAADPCMHNAVKVHELKHVNVDRIIVNKYAKLIGKKVYDGLKQRGFVVGPIPAKNAEKTAARMRKTVHQIVSFEFKKMEIERSEKQQAVDSLEEYNSVAAKCPKYVSPATHAHRH